MFRRTRTELAGVLYALSQLGGIVLWITYIATWQRWQGAFGYLIGIFTFPGIVIFPLIFWIAEHRLPVGYCVLWVVSLALFVGAGLVSADD